MVEQSGYYQIIKAMDTISKYKLIDVKANLNKDFVAM